MELLNTILNLSDVLATLIAIPTIIFSLYLYFRDPLNRWKFLGYRPTVITAILDPKERTLLFVKNWGYWVMPQGGIFTQDLNKAVEDVLEQELGINLNGLKLFYTKELGVVKVTQKRRLKRASYGGLSLFRNLRGKGYIACILEGSSREIIKKLKLGYGIEEYKFIKLKDITKSVGGEASYINPKRKEVLIKTLEEVKHHLEYQKIKLV